MNQRHNNGAAGVANSNVNNNAHGKPHSSKPNVPSKPPHLQVTRSGQPTISNDCVTPKGWAPQKFTFGTTDEKLGASGIGEKTRAHSESVFGQKWRPVPKVMQKQSSLKQRTHPEPPKVAANENDKCVSKYQYAETEEIQNSVKDGAYSRRSHSKSLLLEEEQKEKGFGSLKRMWSQKSKETDGSPQQSPLSRPRNKMNEERRKTVPANVTDSSTPPELEKESLSRSSSGNSVRTTSFKDKKMTWHYVTAQSPSNEFATDALPSKIDLNETLLHEQTKGKKFDHKILAPRPFRASGFRAGDDTSVPPKSAFSASDGSDSSPDKNRAKNRSRRERKSPSLSEDSGSSSGEAEDSDEKEMESARKRGALVTRFDSRGHMYKVNPRTGEVTIIEDTRKDDGEEETRSSSPAVLQRMNAISLEGVTVSSSSTEKYQSKISQPRTSESSSEETPPPLLPRDRTGRGSRGPTVPPIGGQMRSSMTSGSMYPYRNKKQSFQYGRSKYRTPKEADLSPDSTVPPPLLPRGQPAGEIPTQDYTPMSASVSDIPLLSRHGASRESSASLNSFLDRIAYEQMGADGGSYEPMEPAPDEDEISYSAAIDPPKRNLSIWEYHEIDPDPDVPITAIANTGSVPPPPDHEPPALPIGVKSYSCSSSQQNTSSSPGSPPPLPPMNQKKLNYIEVEIGAGASGGAGVRRKSQKTNYTEVVVGGQGVRAKDDSDGKKGKSVKGKLMSMIFTSKHHDGYVSEGDMIGSTKNDEERTTDFAKERNKLKRLSGRLLRKKKHKSREDSRQSIEVELSSQGETSGNVAVGVYGSATNLSTTSSESSRSLPQVTSSGSSGDGQVRQLHGTPNSHRASRDSDRRRSDAPTRNYPPKLDQRSRSEVGLDNALSSPIIQPTIQNCGPQHSHSKSLEGTPQQGYQAQRNGRDIEGSPVISAPRIQSRLHQQRATRKKVLPPSPRPVSEPPGAEIETHTDGKSPRPASTQCDEDITSRSLRLSKSHEGMRIPVLPLPVIRDSKIENQTDDELLSPNFPLDAPPQPPSSRPSPPAETPPDLPPAPMRELKPDRYKKRIRSGYSETDYSAAEDIHHVPSDDEMAGDPVYDDVSPDMTVSPRLAPLSASARSKLLESEPLYQVYRSRTLSHASMKVRQQQSNRVRPKSTPTVHHKNNSEDRWQSDLMTDDAGATTLWREVSEVMERGVGKNLSNAEMKLQQAQFEVVTSQASYMRSLNILIDHFMRDSTMEDPEVLPKKQRKELFSNIVAVREVEQRFLQEIEQHFWDKLYLTDIANITAKYAKSDFEVYVRYIQNQVYQDRVLTDLQRSNDKFAAELTRLESSPSCNKLPLLSFLLLPMQRVTRLPLLISAVVNKADAAEDKDAYDAAKQALAVVNKLVKKCNEGARKMQQTEQLAEIAKELVFAPKVKTYALVSQSRSVVKKGEMSVIMTLENRKTKALKLWFFLFSDVLLLARKKNFLEAGTSAKYEVIDWARRAMLYVNEQAVSQNEIFLVLLENCSGRRVELALTPVSLNELSRWTDALNPQHGESEDSIYESWDCPQYHCIVPYSAQQPDELTLDVGDVMRVLKKTGDGWLEGERLGDNEQGWFPAENCEEIEDEHVRARNLKNLYRIAPVGGAAED